MANEIPFALVTGGCSGLGFATATYLVNKGWRVCLLDICADKGDDIASQLHSDRCLFRALDVCDANAAEKVLSEFTGQNLRLLVNCAGVAPAKRTLSRDGDAMPLEDFSKVININLIGSFNIARIASSLMAENEADDDGQRGLIVNTASVAAYDGQIGQTAYAASKGGLVSLALPMARDLAPLGIRVNTVAPGIMGTPMLLAMPENVQEALANNVQNPKRLGYPEEFAKLVLHMYENTYMNGECIRLDGAIRMPPK